MLDPFDLRSGQAVERFGPYDPQIRRGAPDRRPRLDCEPRLEAQTHAHAPEIRRRKVFAEVQCCFWKEEPSLRDARFCLPTAIKEVYVVPNFISEGYFTQTVIPRELELSGRLTERIDGQIWKYCEPVGNHPAMTELLLQRARRGCTRVCPKQRQAS